MQVLFKTSFDQDIDHFTFRGERIRLLLTVIVALLVPLWLNEYRLVELSQFLIYLIAGVGLMLLTGFAGQVSFGHAAFLAIGAYSHAILMKWGVPFLLALPLAILVSALSGMIVGRSASRMHGFYLAIATLVFSVLVETMIGNWGELTGGQSGMPVPPLVIFGVGFDLPLRFYYLNLGVAAATLLLVANLLRSSTGRSFLAVRGSELASRSLGVNVSWIKTQAFSISAGITGLAGALLAHQLQFLSPETFSLTESLRLLLMIVVGGLGSLLGAVLGAAFISILPVLISLFKDLLPASIGEKAGLEPALFGVIIVLFILFEPKGMAGRWGKIRHFVETFPYYRRNSFIRQKTYLKTERWR